MPSQAIKSGLNFFLTADLAGVVTKSRQPLVNGLSPALTASCERRGKATVASRFREQLQELIQRLEE